MIRKNPINCNLIREDISTKLLFEASLQDFNPVFEVCPFCNARGFLAPHAYYNRYIIDFIDHKRREDQIVIPRYICSSCGHTHAVLPDPIIPYKHYSLLFIIRVLSLHFLHLLTLESICESYGITPTTFQRFKNLYDEHRREWEGLLLSSSRKIKDSLLDLVKRTPFSEFAVLFFKSTGNSFLQTHKNPTLSPRKKKKEDSSFHPPHNLRLVDASLPRYDEAKEVKRHE